MVESAVVRLLNHGESVIRTGWVFEIPNKSIVGSHSLHFTNKGRVFAYDSGGMFGSEKVVQYDASHPYQKLEVNLDGSQAVIKPGSGTTLSFNEYLAFGEFLEFYEKFDHKTSFTYSGNKNCIVKHKDRFLSGICAFEQSELKLNDNLLISFSNVKAFELDESKGIVLLKGLFFFEGETVDELEVFFTERSHYIVLTSNLEKTDSIFSSLPVNSKLASVHVTEQDAEGFSISSPAILAYNNGEYMLSNEISGNTKTFNPNEDLFFFDCKYNKLLVISEKAHLISFRLSALVSADGTDTILGTDQVKHDSGVLHNSIGTINGLFSGEEFTNETISLFYNDNNFHFFSEHSLAVTEGIPLGGADTFSLEDQYFIVFKDSIMVLNELAEATILHDLFADSFEKEFTYQNIGFFDDRTPFILKNDESGVYFFQDGEVQIKIPSDQITNVAVIEQSDETIFSKVLFLFKEEQKDVELEVLLPAIHVKEILYHSFMKKKLPQLADILPKQLFTSWGRQVNDLILYHYLGQLFAIKSGIDQIQKEETEKEVKNVKLINLLYYGLQSQKQMMDKASIYLPAMLEREQDALFQKIDGFHDPSPFKFMQRQLVGSSSHMSRHIAEVQSALNAVSFAIIPKKEMENFARNRALRNGGLAFAAAAIVSLPLGIFMGANAIFSFFDSKKQEQIRKENENLKLDFYVDKALDAFDHFMETMMPYYLSEVNEQLFASFKQVAAAYEPYLENRIVNEALLSRLAEIHAFKQMPIDETVVTKKSELVEEVHQNLLMANLPIQQFQNEVSINVQKPLQIK
ncbi:hypothetical protein AABM38_22355 [Heyndrickxia sp. MSNUG]|uniref:hypothetical protein n=1 Tax=Heyndrickxia sp. MSNUG TaxID=3136677 RepID=UPI003C30C8AE